MIISYYCHEHDSFLPPGSLNYPSETRRRIAENDTRGWKCSICKKTNLELLPFCDQVEEEAVFVPPPDVPSPPEVNKPSSPRPRAGNGSNGIVTGGGGPPADSGGPGPPRDEDSGPPADLAGPPRDSSTQGTTSTKPSLQNGAPPPADRSSAKAAVDPFRRSAPVPTPAADPFGGAAAPTSSGPNSRLPSGQQRDSAKSSSTVTDPFGFDPGVVGGEEDGGLRQTSFAKRQTSAKRAQLASSLINSVTSDIQAGGRESATTVRGAKLPAVSQVMGAPGGGLAGSNNLPTGAYNGGGHELYDLQRGTTTPVDGSQSEDDPKNQEKRKRLQQDPKWRIYHGLDPLDTKTASSRSRRGGGRRCGRA